MIKLFVSDLDGTLLAKDISVSKEDEAALKLARENGIDIAVATGRMDVEIESIQKRIGDSYHRISQNGAFAFTRDDYFIHKRIFEMDVAKKIYAEIQSATFYVLVADEKGNYIEKWNDFFHSIKPKMLAPIEEQMNLHETIGTDIHPSKFIILGKHESLLEFEERMNKLFGDSIETYISDRECLDIMPKRVSKGDAVKKLMKHLKLSPNEVACIGDSFNDIPMLQLTPHSFAMENALPAVKNHANYIVSSVAEAVHTILQMNEKHSVKN